MEIEMCGKACVAPFSVLNIVTTDGEEVGWLGVAVL